MSHRSMIRACSLFSLGLTNSNRLASRVPSSIKNSRCSYHHYKPSGEFANLQDLAPVDKFEPGQPFPEIIDTTKEAASRLERQKLYDEIKALPTPHHKMFLLNVERGRENLFYVGDLHYNSLEFFKFVTRTSRVQPLELVTPQVSSDLLSNVQDAINAQIAVHDKDSATLQRAIATSVLETVRSHLKMTDSVSLSSSRLEAYWQYPNTQKKLYDWENSDNPTDIVLQLKNEVDYLVTSDTPLAPLINEYRASRSTNSVELEKYDYHPEEMACTRKTHRVVSTPGFWYEANQFPLVMVTALHKVLPVSLDPSVNTDHLTEDERWERLSAHGLITNYASALATAYNCGFTMYHEITHPFVSQHITTDGRQWHFSKFQLNTAVFGTDFDETGVNNYWSSPVESLFSSADDGKIKDLNAVVIGHIVASLQAERMMPENLTPHINLDVEPQFLARGGLLAKHMASRRFNSGEYWERHIPDWVKIYKIHKYATQSVHLKWERPRDLHMFQYNDEIYKSDLKIKLDAHKKKNRSRLYDGLYLREQPE